MENKIKKFKNLFFILLFFIINETNLNSFENKILFKVDNEIITSLDLENEINYLISLNPNLKQLSKNEIIEISKNSIINEKIKKIEINNLIKNTSIPKDLLNEYIKNIYTKIGINDLESFKNIYTQTMLIITMFFQKLKMKHSGMNLLFINFRVN